MITRFAPSPTGPLHIGHAYSAILNHDMARNAEGAFLLRMEDTDLQRSKPEWAALIVEDLQWLGLNWDGPVLRQSDHLGRYEKALAQFEEMDLLYPCSCSRADIRAALSAPQEGSPHNVYPGTCRHRTMRSRKPGDAVRFRLSRALEGLGELGFTELGSSFCGLHAIDTQKAVNEIGDVVLSRKGDDVIAYFLASALDDAHQNISHIVRGEDLFEFTPLQVILLTLLELPIPLYHHHGLVRDEAGKRLAKRDDAKALRTYRGEGMTPDDLRGIIRKTIG